MCCFLFLNNLSLHSKINSFVGNHDNPVVKARNIVIIYKKNQQLSTGNYTEQNRLGNIGAEVVYYDRYRIVKLMYILLFVVIFQYLKFKLSSLLFSA